MIEEGYAATQILSQFHDIIIEEKLGDKQKSVITEKMAVSGNVGVLHAKCSFSNNVP